MRWNVADYCKNKYNWHRKSCHSWPGVTQIQLIDFQSSFIWDQKCIELRRDVEVIESNRSLGIINKSAEDGMQFLKLSIF